MTCCTQTNGMGSYYYMGLGHYEPGLGQLDPATIAAIGQAAVHAKDLWDDIIKIFGIGAGAREADAITPLQDQILHTFLSPVSDYLTSINNGTHTPTCAEIQQWQAQESTVETKWLDFLHKTVWKDGRAAQQAEATLAPYFTNIKRDLGKYATQYCGATGSIGSIFTTPTGGINWPVVGVIGIAAYYFMGKKR